MPSWTFHHHWKNQLSGILHELKTASFPHLKNGMLPLSLIARKQDVSAMSILKQAQEKERAAARVLE
jgi:hypothetical protein